MKKQEIKNVGAGAMTQQVKPQAAASAFHMGMDSRERSRIWLKCLGPFTHRGDSTEPPGSDAMLSRLLLCMHMPTSHTGIISCPNAPLTIQLPIHDLGKQRRVAHGLETLHLSRRPRRNS